ncbi:MAG: NADH-quinone oxidoreductase subunit L [Betaproteobacteria bacterium]|jgi:NADH-quinone oxidoreductase subunit L|nr:NADH-quinone oxidoreductase subunit L [Rhodocyclaceae bacterium]MCA3136165.1 NADH-quinone oxidoreductase subunit L [Rhodocyclaceae bacterium]MCA3143304.1 NADH-quinone oxidoreductase subunit L [Rhodocyclaceae bacterium]MCA3146713.1 NADH-quinone oxidoreductase subunit L [Rhodocyclaceae bacterium]MCE2896520.1 NADH-quinone oxidoreductase subunit L [Betaproteobacteria bacterium]
MKSLCLLVVLAPLAGALLAGLLGRVVGRRGAHVATILGVLVSLIGAVLVFQQVAAGQTFNGAVYTWMVSGDLRLEVGFLIDALTATMMLVVTSVSLMVHIYTIGYMRDDPGYQRFFSYISLFTFAMLMLVMSNNFLQLFFGWEAVGLVSYLLIGFWYTRPTAIYANLKAFLVNRVGDFGFLLGIGLVLAHFGSLDYAAVFAAAPAKAGETITLWGDAPWSLITVTCILLFVGAMGKSAQFPLHVWLPDSMEGPTPISALIHAATMVTAGIFMVARMSPLFELSDTALSVVLVTGAITALFMGLLGMVQHDIKRVVAYSTLSQLGYMTVALGVSAYSVAIFHLMTHAFFKALLFLAAGSVIMGMHHDQDIRHMGGLRRWMPVTWITSLAGSLALIGTPFLSGFYSKDSIIEAVHASHLPGAGFAVFAVTAGVFITAFYSFRMYFLVFHGKERFDTAATHDHHHGHDHHGHHGGPPHESPWVVTLPLVLLAIPSLAIGFVAVGPMLHGDFLAGAIHVDARHGAMAELTEHFHGALAMGLHAFATLPFWLAAAGVALAWLLYLVKPAIPAAIAARAGVLYRLLLNKYYLDEIYAFVFAGGARALGRGLWRVGDMAIIDGALVNGSARLVGWLAGAARRVQSGLIYHYAFVMIIGVFALLTLFFVRMA